jgi:hypothetical protein
MSLAEYLLKANIALLLCMALYWLAFRKLTFFRWNRFFLLGSLVLSFILPLIKVPVRTFMPAVADFGGIDWTYVDHLASAPAASTYNADSFSPWSVVIAIYLAVTVTLLLRSAWKFQKLRRSMKTSRKLSSGKIRVFIQDQQVGSFTLFRNVYLDRHAFEKPSQFVLKHEMAHAVQLHSFDLLIMEFVIACLWFNPFVFVHKRIIRENHEYLADRYARGDRSSLAEYLECLRAETLRYFAPVPASNFKSSTIKKRIIMLTNHNSKNRNKLRYLGIIPAVALIMLLFHNPASQRKVLAGNLAAEISPISGPLFLSEGIPSRFPLPEAYKGKISWGYNQNAVHPISKKPTTHQGIDVPAPTGTPVYAAGSGKVLKAEEEEGWGMLVVLEHADGYTTVYAHLDEILVKKGEKLPAGKTIGKVGNTGQSTGPHLHYEVRKNGNPVNPADYY